MNRLIVYEHPEGGVVEVFPAPLAMRPGEPEDAFIERIRAKDVPASQASKVVARQELPDHDFRAAWRYAGGDLTVDLDHAKEIQKDRWRAARGPLLDALDVQSIRATEAGDQKALGDVVLAKQALRDVTDTDLSGITNTVDLKAVWPAALGPKP